MSIATNLTATGVADVIVVLKSTKGDSLATAGTGVAPFVAQYTFLGTNCCPADFNGDSRLDLAVTNVSDGTVSILLGNGNGTFQAAVTPVIVGAAPSYLDAG